jgi:hypothetical protein
MLPAGDHGHIAFEQGLRTMSENFRGTQQAMAKEAPLPL